MSSASSAPAVSAAPHSLGDSLAQIISRDRLLTRPIERIAYASDASFYRLVPRAVAIVDSEHERWP